MDFLGQNFLSMGLILLGLMLIMFSIQFRQYRLVAGDKTVSPKWFKIVRWGGIIAGIALVMIKVDVVIGYFSCLMQLTANSVSGWLCFAVVALVACWGMLKVGEAVTSRCIRDAVEEQFQKDDVCQMLLKDADAGAPEILIFRTRLEGRRGYSFDVDGFNHAAFSETGCKELAGYIMRHTSNRYTKKICNGLAGPQGPNLNSNSANDGAQYKFSHVMLTKAD